MQLTITNLLYHKIATERLVLYINSRNVHAIKLPPVLHSCLTLQSASLISSVIILNIMCPSQSTNETEC